MSKVGSDPIVRGWFGSQADDAVLGVPDGKKEYGPTSNDSWFSEGERGGEEMWELRT